MPARNARVVPDFIELTEVRRVLRAMELDESLKTESSYSANTTLYPDHRIPFAEKHLAYLKSHPNLNPEHYLSNLRLLIRIRS